VIGTLTIRCTRIIARPSCSRVAYAISAAHPPKPIIARIASHTPGFGRPSAAARLRPVGAGHDDAEHGHGDRDRLARAEPLAEEGDDEEHGHRDVGAADRAHDRDRSERERLVEQDQSGQAERGERQAERQQVE